MNPEIIALLTRFVVAHENMAASVNRIANSLHYSETLLDYSDGSHQKASFADELSSKLGDVAAGLHSVAEEIEWHGKKENQD